jgi:hypothetical protein
MRSRSDIGLQSRDGAFLRALLLAQAGLLVVAIAASRTDPATDLYLAACAAIALVAAWRS